MRAVRHPHTVRSVMTLDPARRAHGDEVDGIPARLADYCNNGARAAAAFVAGAFGPDAPRGLRSARVRTMISAPDPSLPRRAPACTRIPSRSASARTPRRTRAAALGLPHRPRNFSPPRRGDTGMPARLPAPGPHPAGAAALLPRPVRHRPLRRHAVPAHAGRDRERDGEHAGRAPGSTSVPPPGATGSTSPATASPRARTVAATSPRSRTHWPRPGGTAPSRTD